MDDQIRDRELIAHTTIERGGKQYPSPAWWLARDGVVWMRCLCGNLIGIGQHRVDDNGDVNPSVSHDWGCGWHHYITLEGWTYGVREANL